MPAARQRAEQRSVTRRLSRRRQLSATSRHPCRPTDARSFSSSCPLVRAVYTEPFCSPACMPSVTTCAARLTVFQYLAARSLPAEDAGGGRDRQRTRIRRPLPSGSSAITNNPTSPTDVQDTIEIVASPATGLWACAPPRLLNVYYPPRTRR